MDVSFSAADNCKLMELNVSTFFVHMIKQWSQEVKHIVKTTLRKFVFSKDQL